MSKFNLFSCHKFLEQSAASLLSQLATCNSDNVKAVDEICRSMTKFSDYLKGHTNWEEQFIFKLLPAECPTDEQKSHISLELELDFIQKELTSSQGRSKPEFHQIYLRFRKFYSELLLHLHDEETTLMKKLCSRFSEHELRNIDHDIYKNMSADDMLAMVKELFPPCNFGEKLAVLEDLKFANLQAFTESWPKMIPLFTEEEIKNRSLEGIICQHF